jgi:hypothetical protein
MYRSRLLLQLTNWEHLSDIGIDGVLRSGRFFDVAVAAGKVQSLCSMGKLDCLQYGGNLMSAAGSRPWLSLSEMAGQITEISFV